MKSEYKSAYERAKRELSDLLAQKDYVEKRVVVVRKSLQTLAALCESEGIAIEDSEEAAYLLKHVALADEIRSVLFSALPDPLRPHQVKQELIKLGRDLREYQNPQATIHMVLKRMAESGKVEEVVTEGKKAYRFVLDIPRSGRFRSRLFKE